MAESRAAFQVVNVNDRRYKIGLRLGRIVAVTPPLILLICIGVYLSALKNEALRALPQLVASAVGTSLKREIRIGGISEAHSFNHITFTSVAVSDAPTFDEGHGRAVAASPQVDIYLNASALIRDPKDAGAYITSIVLTRPFVYVERRPGNKFNFSNLIPTPKENKSKAFAGRIIVHDGTIRFNDLIAPASMQPAVNVATGIDGDLDFGMTRVITFTVLADGAGGRFNRMQAIGNVVSIPTKTAGVDKVSGYDIHIAADDADAAYFTGYFLQNIRHNLGYVTNGRADVTIAISQKNPAPGAPLDIVGNAIFRNADMKFANGKILAAPLTNGIGFANFTGNSLAITASTNVSGIPVTISGGIPSFKRPAMAFRFDASSVDPVILHRTLPFIPALPSWLKFAGGAKVSATAVGPVNLTRFDVAVSSPAVSVYGTRLTNLRARATYKGKTLTIDRFIASTPGRTNNVDISGYLGTTSSAPSRIRARVSSVDLAQISLPNDLRAKIGSVRGIADADAIFATGNAAQRHMPLFISARVRNGGVHGLPIMEGAVDIATDGRIAKIARAIVMQPDGALTEISGLLSLQEGAVSPYDLSVRLDGGNLADLGPQFGMPQIAGRAFFHGKIIGSAKEPEVMGKLNVFAASYGPYHLDQIGATIAASPRKMILTQGVLRRLGANVIFNGRLTGLQSRSPRIVADGAVANAEIADVADIAIDVLSAKGQSTPPALANAVGNLSATIHVAGPLKAPAISASVHVASAGIASVEIANLDAAATYSGNSVKLSSLSGAVEGATITASGGINLKTKAIYASACVLSADLSRIAALTNVSAPISGTADFSATANGTLSEPKVLVTGLVNNFKYRNIAANFSKVTLLYADNVITNDGVPIVLTSGPATYTLEAVHYDTLTRMIAAQLSEKSERLARLISIGRDVAPTVVAGQAASEALSRLPSGLDGGLTISKLTITGTAAHPDVHAIAAVDSLTLGAGGSPDKLDITADVSYADGVVNIARLDGRGRVEYIEASGAYDPAGDINARLEASNIPLQLFKPFLPASTSLGGQISDVTVIASGESAKPEINASVSMVDVTAAGVQLDRIDSGRITVANSRISLAGVTFVKNEQVTGGATVEHVATIKGTLPFDFSLKNGVDASFPANQPVALTAQLPAQSISLVTLFVPTLRADKLGGTISASIDLSGTLAHKTISGALTVAAGTVQPVGFSTAYSNINLNATFDGTKGTITSTPIKSSSGGAVVLTGAIAEVPAAEPTLRYASAADALLSDFRLDLKLAASNFSLNEPKIPALFNAGFHGVINGNIDITGALLKPLIAGNLNVTKAVGTLPAAEATESASAPAPSFNPSFNLNIAVAKGASIKSPQLAAQTDGSATIKGTLYRPDVTADLSLRSGQFRFPTAIFRIQPTGTVHFVYNPPGPTSEEVHIVATTSVSISNALLASNSSALGQTSSTPYSTRGSTMYNYPGATTQRYRITATIDGNLAVTNGLTLQFESNPSGLTTNQILAALGGEGLINPLISGANSSEAAALAFQGVLTNALLPSILLPVENAIEQGLGLAEFSVDYDPNAPIQISVLKTLGPRLDVRYTRFVNSRSGGAVASTLQPLQYTVQVDYHLTNRFGLYVSTDDQNDFGYGLDAVIKF